jgi:hypothetical protein
MRLSLCEIMVFSAGFYENSYFWMILGSDDDEAMLNMRK